MKVYNLNIDTSKPTNQVVQMQQNATGLLSANITNDGNYIRNLSCTMYDGANEISTTDGGFKVEVGTEPKHVKIEAKSEPIICQKGYFVSLGSGHRTKSHWLTDCQIPAGVYFQDEFATVAMEIAKHISLYAISSKPVVQQAENINITQLIVAPDGSYYFMRNADILPNDEPIVVTSNVELGHSSSARNDAVIGTYDYSAFGEYTDYQMDTLIKPSSNAPYDGEYTESLKEIEVDGVKFVPTTLSVDGVEYKVLAEVQPAPEPEPEEPTSNEGE